MTGHGGSGDRRNDRDARRREEDFVRGVLERTSGSPCDSARGRLPDLVDDRLEDLDRQLLRAHLEHCPGCRQVAVVLGWLGPELSRLAELDPGPAFTRRVLAATTRAPAPAIAEPWTGRLHRWWAERIERPLFALQTAYVATVVLVLLTALPGSPLRGTPGKALEAVHAGPAALPLVWPALDAATAWVADGTTDVAGSLGGGVSGLWRRGTASLAARAERATPARARCAQDLEEAVDLAGRGRLGQAGYELLQALRSGRQILTDWWRNEANGV